MNLIDYIGGFDDAVSSIKGLISSFNDFVLNLSKVFLYLPAEFWVIVIAAIVLIIFLRIVGR